ncbi:hypothetical protein [Marinobacter xestospongiae]|uniref:hypothetical protein n=1 Tax=Marinobacter xestospongiae TaxID=994319 RepID=UPI00200344AD|nr:hypothetical protein [Marinobacter xestospongiae]MCK7568810.1 hypothetical protein [Marinobacter xestospongiae]
MSAKSTQVINEVIRRLGDIRVANGYFTEVAGEVMGEDPALYLDEHQALPCIGVRNISDRLTTQGWRATNQTRTIEVVAFLDREPDGRARQDELLQDIYRTLFRPESLKLNGLAVEIEAGEAQLDDIEIGTSVLPIYLPITLTYSTLNWEER